MKNNVLNLGLRKQVDDCKPYIAGETEAAVLKKYGLNEVVKLGSNENPFGPYDNAKKAMQESINLLNRYPEDDYVDLTATLAEINNLSVTNIALGSGAGNVIETVARLLLDEGDEVMVAKPTYRLYREVSILMGATIKDIPVNSDFTYDLCAMRQQITNKTKLIWLCNPNNPTGVISDKNELEEFIATVGENVWIVLDEAYADFINDGQRPEITELLQDKKLIVIRTFSKFYGMAGARVGYIMAQAPVIKAFDTITEPFCVNRVGLFAARATLLNDQDQAAKIKDFLLKERTRVSESLTAKGFLVIPSSSNFIFAKLPNNLDSTEICEQLMAKGVIIRECNAWGYPEYVRITVGKKEENDFLLNKLEEII
ncbi:histidinol-phosphate transaminase [Liquorilactobacillus cacaonum]|uniref:Histidinol-phosphate aminotransferase n=1 Tax=Liquorilactobacillus cacaonum DSM 21116 TaxID=1423729 RepID=A0A0R2CK08_9LACO|nr:histidinol-phosphate transaminase [Liquorilactobacillus cacaonum]KRM91921.1 histidinol-phosphate aminotransferase [Liquorilactobacillus cacaonum DSM 21116]